MPRVFIVLAVMLVLCGNAVAAEPVLLSEPERLANADRAIVFVHGLLGSPKQSFGDWPRLISQDRTQLADHGTISDVAVYAIDYEADFNTHTKLDDAAIGVGADLVASGIFKRHRHFFFVAHSMGGLVLKRILTYWKLGDNPELLDRIVGIGLLGVPSAGAPLADLAEEYGIGTVATAFGWNGQLLKDLQTDGGSYLDSLESNWRVIKVARNAASSRRFTPVISCAFETKPQLSSWSNWFASFFSGKKDISVIVPKLFTSTVCDESRPLPVSHIDLIKPHNISDSVHLWLRNLLIKSTTEANRETRIELTTADLQNVTDPTNFTLAHRVDLWKTTIASPEAVEFADPESRSLAERLVLRGGPFSASTASQAWSQAAKANSCLAVTTSTNRMMIRLKISDDRISCGSGVYVCREQGCS